LKTLVLVSVFNEERTVRTVLEEIQKYTSADILVVNDGSTDDSLDQITESNVTYVINHERNMGPGAALISGFRFAVEQDYDIVVTFDADGQHEARYIPELVSAISDVDMVVGSRYSRDSQRKSQPPRDRESATQALTKLVCKYTNYDVTDCGSGFRAYRVSALRKLRITEKGYGWPFQLWIQAYKAGFRVKEVPIPLTYLDYSRGSHGEFSSVKEAIDKAKNIMDEELEGTGRRADKNSKGNVIWTRDNVGEIIPAVVTPLSWSILDPVINNAALHLYYQLGISDIQLRFVDLFYGRAYINRSALELIFDKLTSLKPQAVVQTCWTSCILPLQIKKSLFFVPRKVSKLRKLKSKELSSEEIFNQIDTLVSIMESCMTAHIACTLMGDVFASYLRKLMGKWGGKYSTMPSSVLLTGLSRMRSAEPGIELWKLSRAAISNEKIREVIVNGEPSEIFRILDTFEDGKEFAHQLKEFMNKYGYFSLQEFELIYPRWEDDPSFILKILKNYLLSENSIDPLTFENKQRKKRIRTTQKIRKELARSKRTLLYRRPIFDLVLFEVQHYVVWRENVKQNFVLAYNQLRRFYVELANRLVDRSLLEEENDIFFLTAEEIKRISGGKIKTETIKEKINSRKRARETNLKSPFPSLIEAGAGSKGELKDSEEVEEAASTITLKGVGCSVGTVTGKARVILDPTEFETLQEGEILVAPFTNPSWTPLFVTARGVITEVGGVSSHGAVVAREYGIPCVVNVKNATKIIKNGSALTIDGEKGRVYLDQVENT
jgi:phosphohistidine swiveling domain-containing protein/glycosyltransferase involved in cell wall biosynthesis